VSARILGIGPRGAVALVLVVFAAVAIANAVTFPGDLGYDAGAHRAYADVLIHRGHIPNPQQSQEFHTPPGFYAIAGSGEAIAAWLGAADPWQVARALNVVWVFGSAILTLLIAGMLFPRQPSVRVAAVAFVAFVPVVLKLASMFHPEALSLFVSTLAMYLTVRLLVRRSFEWRPALVLGAAMGCAQLVQGFNLWLVPIVVAGFAAAALGGAVSRRKAVSTTLVVLTAATVVAGPWYLRQEIRYSNPLVFNRAAPKVPLWKRRPRSFYTGLGVPDVLTNPTRPHFLNRALPTLYSDIWGDYFGYFAWVTPTGASGGPIAPLRKTGRRELEAQDVLGLVPTLLAIGGVIGLLRASLRKRSRFHDPAVFVVALLPLVGLLGFLVFTVAYPSGDGDVIKAAYLLTTAPGWAIGFGYAWSRLARHRPASLFMSLACGFALASDLIFLLHRGSLGPL
jgi:hypothetical protein